MPFSAGKWLGALFVTAVPPDDLVDENTVDDWLLLLACLVTGPTDAIVIYNPIKIINESKDKSTDASDAPKFPTFGYYCMRFLLVERGCAPKQRREEEIYFL